MELTAASVAAQKQVQLQDQVAVGVLKKTIDIQAQQGADLAKMVAEAGGVGQRVDLFA
ncbi:YjfB family protein [Geothrix sp. 21YS21S-4]|uniref:YjfB family protein n=1 Tax=Geothrix sp. 21YS21S-4 TaxID=3068889 RepID=UPI0027B8AE63|nr:YjfB family protein [Geothrix sp. 21YS21S-4]